MKVQVLATHHSVLPFSRPFMDTTVGKVYGAKLLGIGEYDDDGDSTDREVITFRDDAGYVVQASIEHEGISYVVVEE